MPLSALGSPAVLLGPERTGHVPDFTGIRYTQDANNDARDFRGDRWRPDRGIN